MQPTYLALRGKFDRLRDTWAPITHTSTFRETGQITPEEFVQAGDYLVYKFPSWSWSSASSPAKQVAYLPPNKQYLVTRGVPSHRRLDANFAGGEEKVVKGGEGFDDEDGDGEGWLSTGGEETRAEANVGDVRSLGEKGEVDEAVEEDEEEIPDMEDEDDDEDAIIREPEGAKDNAYVEPAKLPIFNPPLVQETLLTRFLPQRTGRIAPTTCTSSTPPTTAPLASTSPATPRPRPRSRRPKCSKT